MYSSCSRVKWQPTCQINSNLRYSESRPLLLAAARNAEAKNKCCKRLHLPSQRVKGRARSAVSRILTGLACQMDRASSLDVVDDSITNEVRGSETGATTSLPVVPLPSQNSPVGGRPRLSSLNGSENGAGSGGVSSAPSLDPARRSSGASGTTAHASSTPRSPLADQGRGKSSGNTSTGADAKSANTGSGGLGSGGAAKPQAASVSGAPPVGESPTAARPGTPESGAASELDRSRGSRTASPGRRAILVSSNSPGTVSLFFSVCHAYSSPSFLPLLRTLHFRFRFRSFMRKSLEPKPKPKPNLPCPFLCPCLLSSILSPPRVCPNITLLSSAT